MPEVSLRILKKLGRNLLKSKRLVNKKKLNNIRSPLIRRGLTFKESSKTGLKVPEIVTKI